MDRLSSLQDVLYPEEDGGDEEDEEKGLVEEKMVLSQVHQDVQNMF